jgi:hypothetical protein
MAANVNVLDRQTASSTAWPADSLATFARHRCDWVIRPRRSVVPNDRQGRVARAEEGPDRAHLHFESEQSLGRSQRGPTWPLEFAES